MLLHRPFAFLPIVWEETQRDFFMGKIMLKGCEYIYGERIYIWRFRTALDNMDAI